MKKTNKKGIVLFMALIFVAVSLSLIAGAAFPVIVNLKNADTLLSSKQAIVLAESGVEDAVFRLNSGEVLSSSYDIDLQGATTEVSVSDVFGAKEVTASGDVDNYFRTVRSRISLGDGVAFNYALQAGNGGFIIEGGSRVNGNIYANGPVLGDGGAVVTGSVVAANSSPIATVISNNIPATPPNSIVFGRYSATQDFAQSFTLDNSAPIYKVKLFIRRTSSTPSNITVSINSDNAGKPSNTSLVSATLASSLVGTSGYGWVEVVFPSQPELSANTLYWLVLDAGVNSTKYYTLAANSLYSNGAGKVGDKGTSTWADTSPSGLDGYFNIYVGGEMGLISGDGYDYISIGSGGVGEAWAHTVNSANVAGTIYCQDGTMNNGKNCNTSRPDPSPSPYPVSDANIEDWKAEASAGTIITGNQTVGWQGATLGPAKIIGNLSINGGGTLTLNGTLWVTGTLSVSGGGRVRLASSYGTNSGVLLVDKTVSVTGGGQFSGSGQTGSYPLLISTSLCPNDTYCGGNNAIFISGGAGAVILNAHNGTVLMSGGTSARSITGKTVRLDSGATVTYESGIADMTFEGGPSGSWDIQSWKEVTN